MADVWFTADTHFGHRAMPTSGKGWRPFPTLDAHDEHLIERWNAHVRPADVVWHLGDVGLGPADQVLATVGRLNGVKHLVPGNHDKVWPGHRDSHKHLRRWMEAFESVQAFARRRIAGQAVMLSHLPYSGDHTTDERYTQYRLRDDGAWLLHGHVHSMWEQHCRQVNVGVDVWEWRPVSLDEVAEIIAAGGKDFCPRHRKDEVSDDH